MQALQGEGTHRELLPFWMWIYLPLFKSSPKKGMKYWKAFGICQDGERDNSQDNRVEHTTAGPQKSSCSPEYVVGLSLALGLVPSKDPGNTREVSGQGTPLSGSGWCQEWASRVHRSKGREQEGHHCFWLML